MEPRKNRHFVPQLGGETSVTIDAGPGLTPEESDAWDQAKLPRGLRDMVPPADVRPEADGRIVFDVDLPAASTDFHVMRFVRRFAKRADREYRAAGGHGLTIAGYDVAGTERRSLVLRLTPQRPAHGPADPPAILDATREVLRGQFARTNTP